MAKDADPIQVLFDLNQELAAAEEAGEKIGGPGLPASIKDRDSFRTDDRLLP
jgi:hypothetical protein